MQLRADKDSAVKTAEEMLEYVEMDAEEEIHQDGGLIVRSGDCHCPIRDMRRWCSCVACYSHAAGTGPRHTHDENCMVLQNKSS